jgi:hypothetical protein
VTTPQYVNVVECRDALRTMTGVSESVPVRKLIGGIKELIRGTANDDDRVMIELLETVSRSLMKFEEARKRVLSSCDRSIEIHSKTRETKSYERMR